MLLYLKLSSRHNDESAVSWTISKLVVVTRSEQCGQSYKRSTALESCCLKNWLELDYRIKNWDHWSFNLQPDNDTKASFLACHFILGNSHSCFTFHYIKVVICSVTRCLEYFSLFGYLGNLKFAQNSWFLCQSRFKTLPSTK